MFADHPQHRLAIDGIPGKGTMHLGNLGAGKVCLPGHQGGDGGGIRSTSIGVIRQTTRHEQCAKVGISQTKGPKSNTVALNGRRRITGIINDNFLCQDEDVDRLPVRFHLKLPIREELQEIDRGQIAGSIVEEHDTQSTGWKR